MVGLVLPPGFGETGHVGLKSLQHVDQVELVRMRQYPPVVVWQRLPLVAASR